MLVLEVAAKFLGNVLHVEILLQRRQDLRGLQDMELLDGVGIDPFLDPAPDGWEV